MVPLSAEKATVVSAGMALPCRSTTVTVNVFGAPGDPIGVPVWHVGKAIVVPPLMVMLAVEPENTTTDEPRTCVPFCTLHATADEPGTAL